MQNFAINGGALNGDPEVWIDSSSVSLVVLAAGEGMRGIVVGGTAPVVMLASLPLAFQAKLEGKADVRASLSGVLTNGVTLIGAAGVKLGATMQGLRWVMFQGVAQAHVEATGDIVAVPSVSATFSMVLRGDLDLKVSTGRQIAGTLPIVLRTALQGYSVRATPLVGQAAVQFAGIGRGNLMVSSPPGEALIRVRADGAARFGAVLDLEGSFEIGTYARGYLESWHHVYAEGSVQIRVQARAEKHGTPIIPGYYVEAPAMRALQVAEETRRFIVPAERRA